jgi:cell wall assembly regulator SMI1
MYSNPKWIPITHDNSGNYVGLDFDPDVRGRQGQVVTFGRDEDEKRVLADSYEAFLEVMLNDITASQWVDVEHLRSASR